MAAAPIVAVFGGGGSLGLRALPLLRAAGFETRCLIRSPNKLNAVAASSITQMVAGDVMDEAACRATVAGAEVVISMLTPPPTHPNFAQIHVAYTKAILKAAGHNAEEPLDTSSLGLRREPKSPSPRLVVVGGAGVMGRSWGARRVDHSDGQPAEDRGGRLCEKEGEVFVTETLPGSAVRVVLPLYGAFFEAHKRNLSLLRDSGLPWTMLCPGFLRDSPVPGLPSPPGTVRTFIDQNDERFGGLSCTYEDLAAVVVAEAMNQKNSGKGRNGRRVGIESSLGYYPSLIPSALRVVKWQLDVWAGR